MEITPVLKEKTKNKIPVPLKAVIYPRINIYCYSIPKEQRKIKGTFYVLTKNN